MIHSYPKTDPITTRIALDACGRLWTPYLSFDRKGKIEISDRSGRLWTALDSGLWCGRRDSKAGG